MESTGFSSYRTRRKPPRPRGVLQRGSFRGFSSRVSSITKSTVRRNTEVKYTAQSSGEWDVTASRPLYKELTPYFIQGFGKDRVIGNRIRYNFLTVVVNLSFRCPMAGVIYDINTGLAQGYYKLALLFCRADPDNWEPKPNETWRVQKFMHQRATTRTYNQEARPALDQFDPLVVAVKAFDEGPYCVATTNQSISNKTIRWSIPLNQLVTISNIDDTFNLRPDVSYNGRFYLALGMENVAFRDYVHCYVSCDVKLSFTDL